MENGMAAAIVSLNDSARIEPEFEHVFARLDYLASDRFDVMWHRHTSGGASIIRSRWSRHSSVSNRMDTFIRFDTS